MHLSRRRSRSHFIPALQNFFRIENRRLSSPQLGATPARKTASKPEFRRRITPVTNVASLRRLLPVRRVKLAQIAPTVYSSLALRLPCEHQGLYRPKAPARLHQ